jgi:hypothetical protein
MILIVFPIIFKTASSEKFLITSTDTPKTSAIALSFSSSIGSLFSIAEIFSC